MCKESSGSDVKCYKVLVSSRVPAEELQLCYITMMFGLPRSPSPITTQMITVAITDQPVNDSWKVKAPMFSTRAPSSSL